MRKTHEEVESATAAGIESRLDEIISGLSSSEESGSEASDRVPFLEELKRLRTELGACFSTEEAERARTAEALSRAEKSFRESERKYRELVRYAPAGIYEVDFRTQRFVSVNDAMCIFSGYTREELLAKNPLDLLDEDSRKMFGERMALWLAGSRPDPNVDYTVIAKDGRRIRTLLDVSFTRDENGRPMGATVVARDITERKKAADALRQAKHQAEKNALILNAIIRQMPAGVIITNADGSEARNNEAMDRIFRRAMDDGENILSHGYQAYHRDGTEYAKDEWPLSRSLQRGETVLGEEMRILRGDGTTGTVLVSSSAVRDDEGKTIAGVVVDADITELRQAEEALRESEEKYRQLFESMTEGFLVVEMILDDSGKPVGYRYLDANPALERLTCLKRKDILGKDVRDVLPGVETHWIEAFGHVAMTGEPLHIEQFSADLGGWYSVYVFCPRRGQVGLIYTNITERKHSEEALARAKAEAEQANRAKSEFLAHMSHEIRTPISGIIGMVDLISAKERDEAQRRRLSIVREAAGSLLSVIGDILDLSRIESGVDEAEPEPWEVRKSIAAALTPFRPEAEKKGLSLTLAVDPAVPEWCLADGEKVVRILRNLVGNAVKYTERGSVAVAVAEEPIEGSRFRFKLSVRDTGVGIPEDKREAIFESFVRLRKSVTERNAEGTGLGLTITRRLADLLGGTITVESEVGGGSEFTVILEPEPAEGPIPSVSASPAPKLSELPTLSILIAEDNRINRLFLESILADAGHRVLSAEDGGRALELIRGNAEKPFDLILMDVRMSVLDGIEATRAIRAHPGPLSEVPVIALTAFAMAGDEKRFREAGMDGYVIKPVDRERLARVMESVSKR